MLMRLGEIQDEVEQRSERWPAEMAAEQRKDRIDLDDLRGELDDLAHRPLRRTEAVDELRDRSRC
jgi:hypothetical protein